MFAPTGTLASLAAMSSFRHHLDLYSPERFVPVAPFAGHVHQLSPLRRCFRALRLPVGGGHGHVFEITARTTLESRTPASCADRGPVVGAWLVVASARASCAVSAAVDWHHAA